MLSYSKNKSSYVRTLPSTLKALKGVSQNLTPKFAICEVSKSLGDVITLPSAPRSRQQASDTRRR